MNRSHHAQALESSRHQLRAHWLCLTQFAQGCLQLLLALAQPFHPIFLIPVACWVEWAETELGRWKYGGRRKAGMGIGSGALEAEVGWTSWSFRGHPSQRGRKRR